MGTIHVNTFSSNADTLDGKHAADFYNTTTGLRIHANYYDIFSQTLSANHPCWNKWCFVVGNAAYPSSSDFIDNAPEPHAALWYEVWTGGIGNRAFQIAIGCFAHQRNVFIRYKHDENWSGWYNVADGGNFDMLDGKHAADLAYLTDVVGGLKRGYASTNAGTIMRYGDREVTKTTNDLSYFGWTVNDEGWFVPIVVSQYPSGTHYEMFGNKFGYGISQDSECASFAYKGRTYYACWSNGGAYLNPTVVGGLHLTLTNDDYISACKTLIDACEAIDSDTLDGMHAWTHAVLNSSGYFDGNAYFLCKENATGDGRYALLASDGKEIATNHAYISGSVVSPNEKVRLWEDSEGGNLRLTSPDGNHYVEMDCYNNEAFRMYFVADGDVIQALTYNFTTKKLFINGNADTVDGMHASDFMPISGETRKYGVIRMNSSDGIYARHIDGNNTDYDGSLYLNYNCPNAPIYMNGSNTAIHSGNIGSQSVNYANSAGNSDTVDGKHASDFALSDDNYWLYTLSSGGGKHGAAHRLFAKHNVKNDGRFYIQDEDTHQVRVNYADGADTANTAGASATTASNICLRNLSSGTSAANTSNCPSGAWYGQYEEV